MADSFFFFDVEKMGLANNCAGDRIHHREGELQVK